MEAGLQVLPGAKSKSRRRKRSFHRSRLKRFWRREKRRRSGKRGIKKRIIMAGRESRHDGIDPFLRRETALVRSMEALSALEKKRRIKAMRKYLRIEDNGIYCKRCGNKILSDADAELCNTYTKNLYGKAVDVFCAQCHTRLFFDNSENVKSEAKPEQDAPPKPPRNSEIPPAAHDTGASGKIDSSEDREKYSRPSKTPVMLKILSGAVVLSVAGISILAPETTSVSPPDNPVSAPESGISGVGPEPSTELRTEHIGNTGVDYHPAVTTEIIETNFQNCAAEYAINRLSDTTAVITTFFANQLIDHKISPSAMTQAMVIDMIREEFGIDLRDAQTYKDVLKCFLANLKGL